MENSIKIEPLATQVQRAKKELFFLLNEVYGYGIDSVVISSDVLSDEKQEKRCVIYVDILSVLAVENPDNQTSQYTIKGFLRYRLKSPCKNRQGFLVTGYIGINKGLYENGDRLLLDKEEVYEKQDIAILGFSYISSPFATGTNHPKNTIDEVEINALEN